MLEDKNTHTTKSDSPYGEVLPGEAVLEPNTLIIEDELLRGGFTSIPNHILDDSRISIGARFAYILLLSFAWQHGSCFPGQKRLASQLGLKERMVRYYLSELEREKLIEVLQRGLGKTNVYIIKKLEADRQPIADQDRQPISHQERQAIADKEYSVEVDPGSEEYSDTSKFRRAMSLEKNNNDRLQDKGLLTENIALGKKEKPAQEEAFSSSIAHVLDDLSKFDLHDPVHVSSNITRAMNLWQQSKLNEEEFIELVRQAKQITFKRSGSIRKEAGYMGLKNLAPYFFQVLKDLTRHMTLTTFAKDFAKRNSMA